MRKSLIWLIIPILLIALGLRLYKLADQSLWLDECSVVYLAKSSPQVIIQTAGTPMDSHPPLYNLFMYCWVKVMGDSEFSVRFPSVVFGAVAVGIIYLLGRRLYDKETGLLAALLLACSWFHIWYSQEARSYALMTLSGLLSLLFLASLMERWRWSAAIGYILSSVVLTYSHVYGPFFIVAQNVFYLIQLCRRRIHTQVRWYQWVGLQTVVLGVYAFWLPTMFARIADVQRTGLDFISKPGPYDIIDILTAYAAGSGLFLGVAMVVGTLAWVRFRRIIPQKDALPTNRESNPGWEIWLQDLDSFILLMTWLFVPIMLSYVISQVSTPILYLRYTIAASVAFYLLVARGLRNLPHRYLQIVVLIFMVGMSLKDVHENFTMDRKEQWRQMTHYLDEQAKSNDVLVFNPGWVYSTCFDHYSRRTDWQKKAFLDEKVARVEKSISQLSSIIENTDRFWLILWHPTIKSDDVERLVPSVYHRTIYKPFHGLEVYLFEKNVSN